MKISMTRAVPLMARVVNHKAFDRTVCAIILLNSLVMGLEAASVFGDQYTDLLKAIYRVVLALFIAEVSLKMAASWPRPWQYLQDGMNVLDLLVIAFALVPGTSDFALIIRLTRLHRVLRLETTMNLLRPGTAAGSRFIPGAAHIMVVMVIVVYAWAVIGFRWFHERDPILWGDLWSALQTMSGVFSISGWEAASYTATWYGPIVWMYFACLILSGLCVAGALSIAVMRYDRPQAAGPPDSRP